MGLLLKKSWALRNGLGWHFVFLQGIEFAAMKMKTARQKVLAQVPVVCFRPILRRVVGLMFLRSLEGPVAV